MNNRQILEILGSGSAWHEAERDRGTMPHFRVLPVLRWSWLPSPRPRRTNPSVPAGHTPPARSLPDPTLQLRSTCTRSRPRRGAFRCPRTFRPSSRQSGSQSAVTPRIGPGNAGSATVSSGSGRAGLPPEDGIQHPGGDPCSADPSPSRPRICSRQSAADPLRLRLPSQIHPPAATNGRKPSPRTASDGSPIVRPGHAIAYLPLVDDVGRGVGVVAQLPAKPLHVGPQQPQIGVWPATFRTFRAIVAEINSNRRQPGVVPPAPRPAQQALVRLRRYPARRSPTGPAAGRIPWLSAPPHGRPRSHGAPHN